MRFHFAAKSVRIFAPIPGTSLVGIEIPNEKAQAVNLADVLPFARVVLLSAPLVVILRASQLLLTLQVFLTCW